MSEVQKKKIRLDPGALRVQSFSIMNVERARGTVRAAQTGESVCYCYPISYWLEESCEVICPDVPASEPPACPAQDTADDTCATCAGQPGC